MTIEKKYSFVVPAYNEEKNIGTLYRKIVDLMKAISNNWELIFINDGSHDSTLALLIELSLSDKKVKYINFSRNFGQQAALIAGLKNCSGDAIITLDCDLQDPPQLISQMIEQWNKGFDIVYARRIKRNDRLFKKYSAILYYKLLDNFSDIKIPRNVGDFRLIDKKVLTVLTQMNEKAIYLRGMVAWVGFKHTFVDFERPERTAGETNYTLKKMLKLSMDGLITFSLLPLKLGMWLGLLSITLGTSFLIYMVIDMLINHSKYELFKWLSVIIFIFFGFTFVLIWILGEYIGRIYNEAKNRPIYIIDKKGNFDADIDAQ